MGFGLGSGVARRGRERCDGIETPCRVRRFLKGCCEFPRRSMVLIRRLLGQVFGGGLALLRCVLFKFLIAGLVPVYNWYRCSLVPLCCPI